MVSCRILLIEGHPDPIGSHLCHALADAYAEGAQEEGHQVRRVHVAKLDFPLLRSQQDWEFGELPESLKQAQEDIAWAQHLVLFFPLWLGDMPALLKGFLEQIARPGFAFKSNGSNMMSKFDPITQRFDWPTQRTMSAASMAPGWRATSLPLTNKASVGMLRML